jgi:hypothetical protein
MNTQEIANALWTRRQQNPIVMQGELQAQLGGEGFAEAVANRWVVPDYDTGGLTVTLNAAQAQSLEAAAKATHESVSESHDLALRHSGRTLMEINAPGLGPNSGGAAMPRPPAPATPTTPITQQTKRPQIGDDVMVAEQGKSFTGKVQTMKPDGRYVLSFGNTKPPMDRDYGPDELRMVAAAAPGTGQGAPVPHA